MTAYDTAALATEIIGEDEVTKNRKSATRRLRKFLRADEKNEKALHTCPGKGGRYSIDLNKTQLRAMKTRFTAWQKAEQEAAEQRKAAREVEAAKVTPKTAAEQDAETDSTDEVEGPTDDEILEMLNDQD